MSLHLVIASSEKQEMYTPLLIVCSEIIITANAESCQLVLVVGAAAEFCRC